MKSIKKYLISIKIWMQLKIKLEISNQLTKKLIFQLMIKTSLFKMNTKRKSLKILIAQFVHLHQECLPLCAKIVNNFTVISVFKNITKKIAQHVPGNYQVLKSCENLNKKLPKYKLNAHRIIANFNIKSTIIQKMMITWNIITFTKGSNVHWTAENKYHTMNLITIS